MNKSIIWIIVILAIVVVGFMFYKTNYDQNTTPTENEEVSNQMPAPGREGVDEMVVGDEAGVKSFDITGQNFEFSAKEIRVKQGDTVRINFSSASGFHDLKIDEFNVATKQLQDGGSDSVEFVADKAGTFEYYCSVGSHRQMGMVGKLIVE